MSIIVTLSGGKASAYCAKLIFDKYPKEDVILYFNDTKWEHPDLYRFLDDLSAYFNHPIIHDSDGRSVEDLFFHYNALANSRMAFCSQILKAQRLHDYYKDGDTLVFGIDNSEKHRADRIEQVYVDIQRRKKKSCKIEFPLIENKVIKEEVNEWLKQTAIEEPLLYKLGFSHNNCSGGCVRAGERHWTLLYKKLPKVYLDRERAENEIRLITGRDITILKNMTLTQLRETIENDIASEYDYDADTDGTVECIGICSNIN